MENDDRKNNAPDASESLTPTPNIPNQQSKKPNKSAHTSQKAKDDKKKSYCRSWRSASPIRKIEIFIGALLAAGALGYLGATIWGNLQTKWNFEAEHRPRVIFTRPPQFIEPFTCDVEKEMMLAGKFRVWFRNIGNEPAHVLLMPTEFHLVPNKPFDIPILKRPVITDKDCEVIATPYGYGEFIVNPGPEEFLDSEHHQQNFPGLASVGNDATFEFYCVIRLYYSEDSGSHHGTCVAYRFTELPSGKDEIRCGEQITGFFQGTLFNECMN
jgi:hypothetical protein